MKQDLDWTLILMCLSWVKYEYDPPVKIEEAEHFDISHNQGVVVYDPGINTIFIVFRGTDSFWDLITNFRFKKSALVVPYSTMDSDSNIKVHTGFRDAWFSVRGAVNHYVERLLSRHPNARLVFTGHSLGGVLAQFAALDWQFSASEKGDHPEIHCITFGAPRWGNVPLTLSYEKRVPNTTHLIYSNDPIPALPPYLLGFVTTPMPYSIGVIQKSSIPILRLRNHTLGSYENGILSEMGFKKR